MTTDRPTLTIRVGTAADTKAQFRTRLAAMERGEDVDEMHVLNLESVEDVERLFRATNLELLATIAQQEPSSIRETAALVDRGHKEVLQNLDELERLGLVAFERDGRAKRPRVEYSDLEIDISLTGSSTSAEDPTTV